MALGKAERFEGDPTGGGGIGCGRGGITSGWSSPHETLMVLGDSRAQRFVKYDFGGV